MLAHPHFSPLLSLTSPPRLHTPSLASSGSLEGLSLLASGASASALSRAQTELARCGVVIDAWQLPIWVAAAANAAHAAASAGEDAGDVDYVGKRGAGPCLRFNHAKGHGCDAVRCPHEHVCLMCGEKAHGAFFTRSGRGVRDEKADAKDVVGDLVCVETRELFDAAVAELEARGAAPHKVTVGMVNDVLEEFAGTKTSDGRRTISGGGIRRA